MANKRKLLKKQKKIDIIEDYNNYSLNTEY
jgi:hypothetical protein